MCQDEFEKFILKQFLSYGDELSNLLFMQIRYLEVKNRLFTGVGFFTNFSLPQNNPNNKFNRTFEGISVKFKHSMDTMNFILYVERGKISCLEGYTICREWAPADIDNLDMNSFTGGGLSSFI